ncbi:MAG TPA: glutamate--tRNA ligase [Acidimicrobiia bacterium]|nr:glutamate--tRNA ligase [Acidimicrobiia bacterium]
MTTRLRIAPSPTGAMHVGTGRTALFNWLYARHSGGTFIVRIDDTDDERNSAEFEADILAGLRWLGLDWDEGVGVGGPHGTYRQSDRYERYRQVALELVEREAAYFCFCTPAELARRRDEAAAAGKPPGYDGRCRTIPISEAIARRGAGEAAAVRFKMPRPGVTEFDDLVKGKIRVDHEHVDDFVLLRSDGRPTYHLASTTDDVDYEISHVARGEDLLPSTPRHIQLTLALGAKEATYAHLPLILGTDGKRLSKRHGATGVTEYIEAGYLPQAMVNYLSLLGWSPAGDVTIVSLADSIRLFDLASVSTNPAVFDQSKLDWMNGEYIRSLSVVEFLEAARPFVIASMGRELSPEEWERLARIAPLVQERTKFLTEVGPQVRFLFTDELEIDPIAWEKVMGDDAEELLGAAIAELELVAIWEHDEIERSLRSMLERLGLNARKGLQPLRVAVTGSTVSPPLFESMAILGRDSVLARLADARKRVANMAQDDHR